MECYENQTPIRILHVVQRMEAAGVQSFIMNIYRAIDRNKVQFDFLTHYSERQFYDDEIERLGGRIYRLSVREDKDFIKYIRDLKKFFMSHPEYKIVHGHMDSLGFFYLGAAKNAGVPIRIAHAHTLIEGGDLIKRLRHQLNRFYKTNATFLAACSIEAGVYMFGNNTFKVIHNPIEIDKFKYNPSIREQVRKEFNIEESMVIGNVGRFAQSKNHHFLLEVLNKIKYKIPNTKLVLIGNGELMGEIKSYGNKLGLNDAILYLGVRSDVNRIYQAMDAFVFPSKFEGLGIVAIEAQASGLPTICSENVPSSAGVTDLFCQLSLSDKSDVWAEKIISEVQRNERKDQSGKLKKAGYDVRTVSSELISMYEKMWGGTCLDHINVYTSSPYDYIVFNYEVAA